MNESPPILCSLHASASAYLTAGLCVVPAHPDKRPALPTWKDYQHQLPVADEVDAWFAGETSPAGLGLVCGNVSGGFEAIDLDAKNDPTGMLNARFEDRVREIAPGLWEKLYIEESPTGGRHLCFRSRCPSGNHQLALSAPFAGEKNGRVLVETRGEGGFLVVAPTPGYKVIQGDFATLPILSAEEREDLIVAGRSLDESVQVEAGVPKDHRTAHILSPLDDFNSRGDALALLRDNGWTVVGQQRPDGSYMLRRPGKETGQSATWNYAGRGTLCVFSSSTVFQTKPTTYRAAAIYALLKCNGDFSRAASELRLAGFGSSDKYQQPLSITTSPAASVTTPRPYTVWTPDQFLGYVAPSGSVILGDAIMELGKWTSMVGIGGIGKTRLALFLAVCQILGREWCGIRTYGPPLIWLFLSPENGLRRWQTDLRAMTAGLTESERSLVNANIRIMALTPEEEGSLNAGSPADMERLRQTLLAVRPGVIVFDPFAEMIHGDENLTSAVISTLQTLRRVIHAAAPAAAVLALHHARTGASNIIQAGDNYNSGNFGRGSKGLYSSVRAEIQLAPGDREDSKLIVMACGKNSDGEKFKPRGIVYHPEDGSYSVDPDFSYESWRDDVEGRNAGKSCSIADAVEAVRQLAPSAGMEAMAGPIVDLMKLMAGTQERTCKTRLTEAVKAGYLTRVKGRRGAYKLGPKTFSA